MTHFDNLTLCLTIGKRPEPLRQTLQSLLGQMSFAKIIAINDFGDEPTNRVFQEFAPSPQNQLICLGRQIGHHRAVDEMYRHIDTPYVLHCEDDWLFDRPIDAANIIALLEHEPQLTAICLRHLDDMTFSAEEQARFQTRPTPYGDWVSLAAVHEQWYGYTFNPHIAKIDTYRALAPFAQFKKERHISRTFRAQGRVVGFLPTGACRHIGFESVANPPKNDWLSRLKRGLWRK